ncbi:AAA family ATPase [Brevibacterium permense]|nr:AAA family ATPase [Brevibacterium permense]
MSQLPSTVPTIRGWQAPPPRGSEHIETPQTPAQRRPISPAQILHRPEESAEIAAQLVRRHPPIVSITGRPGTGRTAVLHEVVAQLRMSRQPMILRPFVADGLSPTDALQARLESVVAHEASVPEAIVIDDFDQIARLGKTGSIDRDFIERVSQAAALGMIRFLIVLNDERLDALEGLDIDLTDTIAHIRLGTLPRDEMVDIVRTMAGAHVDAAGFSLNEDQLASALAPAAANEYLGQPGLAISRVETAVARARQRGGRIISGRDLECSASNASALSAEGLKSRLLAEVRGQDAAVSTLAGRLAPALTGLKLRPERPHGVFLFAGPSGVGKTETAKRLADTVYGSPDALIRLDMSEYANEDDARMKLIGASKVWKNSSTEGLLTTKVIEKPRSVILLDEFEKPHPSVWNVFLQVFDEGMLTDGRGRVASFAESIIILTSNLGAREASVRSAGFGEVDQYDASRQDAAISDALPPELQGRLTATVHFDPLSVDALRELARMELERAMTRFEHQGWQIDFDDDVVEWVVHSAHDARFGARQVQRTIESEIFPLLASRPISKLRVRAEDGQLSVDEAEYPC